MAVWGTPVAAEGDAERAVRAALDLVGSVADLRAEAQRLRHLGDDQAAAVAIGEAVEIAERLGCRPLLGRAADLHRSTADQGHGGEGTRAGESAAVGDG